MTLVTTTVELNLNAVWTDVTAYAYTRDAIQVRRGRADESSSSAPAECRLTLNNRDGRFSPRNPTGPYYGAIGRNTPLRVTVTSLGTGPSVRFVGEVAAWPISWEHSESDVWVQVSAAGIRRRLSQGQSPIKAAFPRAVTGFQVALVAYWPMDDPEGSEQFASEVAGVSAVPTAGFTLAADGTSFPSLPAPLPVFAGGSFAATIPTIPIATPNGVQGRLFFRIPTGLGGVSSTVAAFRFTGGAVGVCELGVLQNTGQFVVSIYDYSGAFLAGGTTGLSAGYLDTSLLLSFSLRQNGTSATILFDICTPDGTLLQSLTGTRAATDIGDVVTAWIGGAGIVASRAPLTAATVGHFYVQDSLTPTTELGQAYYAYAGEKADDRIHRLCLEEDIPLTGALGPPFGVGVLLGPQLPATLLDLLDEAALADGGILTEQVDALGLTYTAGQDLYNQDPVVTLDYDGNQLFSFTPVEDDQGAVNDLTVTREGGSSARYELTTGALSVNAPPAGIGRYDSSLTLSLQDDSTLADQAAWRVHVATVDEARYPEVGFNLLVPAFTTGLQDDVLSIREGDAFTVTDPPAFAGSPDDVRQLVAGWQESIHAASYDVTLIGIPATPYDVGVYDDTGADLAEEPGSRYSSDGTTANEAIDTTETAIDIITPTGPLWTTSGGSYPLNINIGGEKITVGGCTGATSAQTFTGCTRSVNGVVKSHLIGAAVTLWQPARYAL